MPDLKKNFFYSVLLTLANYVFPLITYPYVSRVLGVSNLGICDYVDGTVNYFIMFSMMGIATVGVREIAASCSERSRLNRVFSSLVSINAITSILAAVALSLAIFLVPKLYAYKELMGIGVIRLLANFLCMEWLFKGLENFRYITLRSVAIKTMYMVAVFVFVRQPGDYGVYYFLLTLSVVINAIVNVLYSRKFVSFSTRGIQFKEVAGPYFLIGLYVVMAAMYTSFNVVFLGLTSTSEQVGYYGSATRIFGIIIAMFTAFTTVLLPRLSAVLSEGKEDEFRLIVLKVLRMLFCLGVPLVMLMEAEAGDIIRIISGPGYEGAIIPMRIISPLILIIGMEQVYVLQTMMPKKYDREVMVNSAIGAIVGVSLNFLLVRSLEAVGSSIVWLVSEMTVLLCSMLVVSRKAGIRFPIKSFISTLFGCIPLGILLAFIPGMAVPFYVRFILASALTAVYFLLINLVILPNKDVKDCLKAVVPKRWWDALHQLRSHLYLLRVMPLDKAFSLIWNRVRFGFSDNPDRRYLLNEQKHDQIYHFLKDTLGEEVLDGAGPAREIFPEESESLPIWVCWLQGEESMPELNKVCLKSIQVNAGRHPVVFLSQDNIPDYLDVPDCIRAAYIEGRIMPAIYADYVRCALLARYGGVWVDSTILLTAPLEGSWFSRPFTSVRQGNSDNASVSRYRWASFCLGAVPGSPFFRSVEKMFRMYFSKEKRNVDYLMIDYFFDLLYREDPEMAAMVDGIPESNPEMHTLRGIMNEPYDPDRKAFLVEHTSIFKLTYKMPLEEKCGGSSTFWGLIRQTGFGQW